MSITVQDLLDYCRTHNLPLTTEVWIDIGLCFQDSQILEAESDKTSIVLVSAVTESDDES